MIKFPSGKKKSRILYRTINTFLPVKRGDVPNGCIARDTVFHLVRIRTVVLLVLSLATQNCLFALNRHIRLMSFVLSGYSLCFVFLFLFFSTNYSVPQSSFFYFHSLVLVHSRALTLKTRIISFFFPVPSN